MNDGEEQIGSNNADDAMNMSRDEVLEFLRQTLDWDPFGNQDNDSFEWLTEINCPELDETNSDCESNHRSKPEATPYDSLKSMVHMSLSTYLLKHGLGSDNYDALQCLSEEQVLGIAKSLLLPSNANTVIHVSSKKIANEIALAALREFDALTDEKGFLAYLYTLPIEELKLGTRSSNILKRAKVETIADLCALGRGHISEMRNSGAKTIAEIEEALRDLSHFLVDDFNKRQSPIGNHVRQSSSSMSGASGLKLPLPKGNKQIPQELFSIELDVTELSTRARNALRFAKTKSLGEILALGEGGLLALKNTGIVTVAEILECANGQMESYLTDHPRLLEDAAAEESEDNVAEQEEIHKVDKFRKEHEDEVKLAVRDLILGLSESMVVSPAAFLLILERGSSVDKNEAYDALAASAAQKLLTESPWGLTVDEIRLIFSSELDERSNEFVNRGVEQAIRRGLIQEKEGLLFSVDLPLSLMVDRSINDVEEIAALSKRIEGKTSEEISVDLGITGERVRQILQKATRKLSLDGTRAKQYYLLLKSYELTERHCCDGLGATREEWNAASHYFDFTDGDSGEYRYSATELLRSQRLPQRVKLQLEEAIYYGYIKLGGEYVKASRQVLALHVLKLYGSKRSIADAEFISRYYEFLAQHGLDADGEFALSERYTSTMRHNECVISGNGKRMRYYDYREYDIPCLLKELRLREHFNKEISTRVFLRNNPEVLSDYGLDDPYELHSVLRKYYEANKEAKGLPYRPCRRMPMIIVGKNADREEQVKSLAKKLAPISIDDLANAYEQEYGVEPSTFKTSYLTYVKQYVSGGYIKMNRVNKKVKDRSRNERDYAHFDFIEAYRLRENLTDDRYSLVQIKKIYFKLFPDGDKEKLNKRAIEDLGFEVHAGVAIRKKR